MAQQETVPKRWLTYEECAEYIRMEPSTIRTYVSEGRIPYCKIPNSNQVRFSIQDVDLWIAKGRVWTNDEHLEAIANQKGTK